MAVLAQDRNELDPLFNESSAAVDLLDQLIVSQGPNIACMFHDAAQVVTNINQSPNLSNLSTSLALNHLFFGAINAAIVPGSVKALTSGSSGSNDQYIARSRLLIPPQMPMASAYSTPNQLPAILGGAGCDTELGQGVGPATQAGFSPAGQDAHASQLMPPSPQESQVPGAGGTALPASQTTAFSASGGAPWLLFPLSLGVVLVLLLAWPRRSPRSRRRPAR